MPPKACKKCQPLVDQTQSEVDKAQGEIRTRDNELSTIRAERDQLQRDVSNERSKSEAAVAAERKLHQHVGELEADRNTLAAAESDLKKQLQQKDADFTTMKADLAGCRAELARRDEIMDGQQSGDAEAERLKAERLELEGRLDEASRSLGMVRNQHTADLDEKSQLEAQLRAQLEKTEEEVAQLRLELARLATTPKEDSQHTEELGCLRKERRVLHEELAKVHALLREKSKALESRTAIERKCQRLIDDGALLARPNLLDPAVAADRKLSQLRREGEMLAVRRKHVRELFPAQKGEFPDSLEVELALASARQAPTNKGNLTAR